MKRVLLGLGFVVLLLAFTNPSRGDFNAWAQNHVARKIAEQAKANGGDPADGSAQIGGAIAGFFIANLPIERTNLLAFSVYSLRLPDGKGEERECRFLGVAGQFVPLGKCLDA